MILLSNLLGQSALSLRDASEAGRAVGVLIQHGRVVEVELDSGARVPASAIPTFEGDALTFHGVVDEAQDGRDDAQPHPSTVRGLRVLTQSGRELGTVDDLELGPDGQVQSVILSDGVRLPGARVEVAGRYAAIVTDPTARM